MAGGAGAGGYMQMGTALSGDLVGGIGGMIEALNYKKPRLKEASGMEQRLRQLAQAQLLAGGQQTLAGTALYNQLAPILMSQLPGMHYVPGTGDTGTGQAGAVGSSGSPMANYQQALQAYQNQQGLQQQLQSLKAQRKGMKPGADRRALKQQIKGVRKQVKSLPSAASLERQEYLGGVQQNPALFNVSMSGGGGDGGGGSPSSAGGAGDSLAAVRSLMDSLGGGPSGGGGGGGQQSLADIYRSAAGGGSY